MTDSPDLALCYISVVKRREFSFWLKRPAFTLQSISDLFDCLCHFVGLVADLSTCIHCSDSLEAGRLSVPHRDSHLWEALPTPCLYITVNVHCIFQLWLSLYKLKPLFYLLLYHYFPTSQPTGLQPLCDCYRK